MSNNKLKYKSKHAENRMKYEGDTLRARNYFYNSAPDNLKLLLQKRYVWMNEYIAEEAVGIEVGAGTGVSKEFIKSKNYKITDYTENEWLDSKMIDALNTGIHSESLDFVVSSNMIHHVPYPMRFFSEMSRILKRNGVLIIQEINCSSLMRYLLRIMRHEGYDFSIDVFDQDFICTDPADLWSANCAIPNLLFDQVDVFTKKQESFRIIHSSYSECLLFINSGGVISKTFCIPLPRFLNKLIAKIDEVLVRFSPQVFALQRQIVLQKIR